MWRVFAIMMGCVTAGVFTVTGWPQFDRPPGGPGLIVTLENSTYRRVIHIGQSPVHSLIGAQLSVAPRTSCSGGVHRSRWNRGVVMIITPSSATGPIDGRPLASSGSFITSPLAEPGTPTPSAAITSQEFKVYASKRYAEEGRLNCPTARAMTRYSLSSGWNTVRADTKDTPGVRYAVVQGAHPQERTIELATRLVFGR